MDKKPIQIVEKGGKNQNQREPSTGLIVEKDTDQKEKGVSHQHLAVQKTEDRKNKEEKNPKIMLREQQRRLRIKRERVF
jgi:hypothetical protein